ncbi:MAG: hypothetical protein MRK02_01625 [Candidatus Scalindua sp.]|nr:hypothetical protein [Candidatus Scalindua sp.]
MKKNPIPVSAFNTFFEQHNDFHAYGFSEWVFCPGMLFQDLNSWWTQGNARPVPHEGIDLCLFRDRAGKIHRLDEKARIPVMYDGVITHIHDDFLGKSIYVRHSIDGKKGCKLHSIYGHVLPGNICKVEHGVREGDIIATIAPAPEKGRIPPHAHITLAWLPETLSCEKLNWEELGNPDSVTLSNPLDFIDCKYSIEDKIKMIIP